MASSLLRPSLPPPSTWWALSSPCPPQTLFLPSFWNLRWPSSQTQAGASSLQVLSSPPPPHPAPPLPVWGEEGVGKGRSREGGRGNKKFKTNNKKTVSRKKKERKKQQQPKSEKLSEGRGADSTRKEKKTKTKKPKPKNQKDPFFFFLEKKKKRKKFFAFFFSKFCGETSRYWALFSKISRFFNALQMFAFSASDRLLKILGLFLTFQLCHQFANLIFFFSNVVLLQIKVGFVLFCFFKCYMSQVSKQSELLPNSKRFIQFFGVFFFPPSDIPISFFT